MINVILVLIGFIMNIVLHLIEMIKLAPLWEKGLIIILFFIPVPFTMEGYLILKGLFIKTKNRKK